MWRLISSLFVLGCNIAWDFGKNLSLQWIVMDYSFIIRREKSPKAFWQTSKPLSDYDFKTLLSTKPGLQKCLNYTGLNSKNGGKKPEKNIFRKKSERVWETLHVCFHTAHLPPHFALFGSPVAMVEAVLSAQLNCCFIFFTANLAISGFCKRKINQQTEILYNPSTEKNTGSLNTFFI